MNPEAREELDRILAIEPAGLTENEAGFLRARRSYLSEEQRTVYAEVLGADAPVADEAPEDTEAEAPVAAEQPRTRRGRASTTI